MRAVMRREMDELRERQGLKDTKAPPALAVRHVND